jgi:hypothetical protein
MACQPPPEVRCFIEEAFAEGGTDGTTHQAHRRDAG